MAQDSSHDRFEVFQYLGRERHEQLMGVGDDDPVAPVWDRPNRRGARSYCESIWETERVFLNPGTRGVGRL
jgi:hypothetical protein